MARPANPDSQYRIKPHIVNCYKYASTQPAIIDPNTGKKKYRYIHWGTVDENLVFIPGSAFYLASPEVRSRLIFPENWDIGQKHGDTPEKLLLTLLEAEASCMRRRRLLLQRICHLESGRRYFMTER